MRNLEPRELNELGYAPSDVEADADALLVYNLLLTRDYLEPCIERCLRELKLTGAQFNALLVLRAAGEDGLPLGGIGRHLVVTKANVTGLIDRLEREGLVCRSTHSDRRVTLAKLTVKGSQLLEEALPHHHRLLVELTDCLEAGEKEQLVALLTKLRRGLREKQQKPRILKEGRPIAEADTTLLSRVAGELPE